MPFPFDHHAHDEWRAPTPWDATSFIAFREARERYLSRLHAESESQRGRSARHLPSVGTDRRGDVPSSHPAVSGGA